MSPASLACLCLCLCLLLGLCSGHDWSQTVPLDSAVTLSCRDAKLHPFNLLNDTAGALPAELTSLTWYLPGRKQLDPASPPGGFRLNALKTTLTLTATKANEGVYHCAAFFNRTQWFYIKRGVNPQGPRICCHWERYRQAVINGLSSAAAFFACCCLLVVVYVYRWTARFGAKSPETELTPKTEFTTF